MAESSRSRPSTPLRNSCICATAPIIAAASSSSACGEENAVSPSPAPRERVASRGSGEPGEGVRPLELFAPSPQPSAPVGERGSFERAGSLQRELAGEAVALGQGFDLVPGRLLDIDAVLAAVLLAPVLDLAGIEHAAAAFGRRRLLQIFDELADLLLELGERPEGVDLEHRHEAAIVVPPGRLDPEAEPSQQPAQDFHHDGEAGALVAALRAAQWQ